MTYDERKGAGDLDTLYLCAPIIEVTERMANATLLFAEYDRIDSIEGPNDALAKAKDLLT